MSWLARRLAHDPAMIGKIEEMKQTADGIIQSIGRISIGLRPGVLDVLGLEAAIKLAEPGVHRADRDHVRVARPPR